MTIDGPVALFKSSTNCSRAPFSAPGPYCWSGPLKARPGPKQPEAPARVQPCASPARRLPVRLPGRCR
ncbi:rCG45778, isoform CRA_a [Rattus norvegicus]|uniref:RCG45778, isoform CRA_a n=1 Tax=Rattus norvegicus TaxID=10116 RepID=A6JTS8_RAT|nr:rCG45778, isoform CRA_a [Rattus norvegicus]EDL93370.1 rCG45778, isoform CRA_a [Rattus norvegicus]